MANASYVPTRLIAYLESLPPSVNPYLATTSWLLPQISPPAYSTAYEKLIIAFAVLFGVQTALLLLASATLLLSKGAWLFRITRDGLWQTNSRLAYALGCLGFCAANTASLVRQVLINQGKLDYHNRIALEGLRWIPLWYAGWAFVYGCVANIVSSRIAMTATPSSITSVEAGTSPKARSRWPIWTLNTLCVGVPIVVIASVAIPFGIGNRHLNTLIDTSSVLAIHLAAASVTYRPGSFDALRDMQPFFGSLAQIDLAAAGMQKCWHIGFGLWSAYLIGLVLFLSPHFFRHLVLLRRLMGASSFFTAIMPSRTSHSPAAPKTSSSNGTVIDVRLDADVKTPLTPSPPSSPTSPAAPTISQSWSPESPALEKSWIDVGTPAAVDSSPPPVFGTAAVPASFAGPALPSLPRQPPPVSFSSLKQPPVAQKSLRNEYRKLLISGVVIYIGFILYAPVALWSAITPLSDPAFWKGEIVWADMGYIITSGLFANVIFVYVPAWKVWKQWLGAATGKAGKGGKMDVHVSRTTAVTGSQI